MQTRPRSLVVYQARKDRFPFMKWLKGLKDYTGRAVIERRLKQVERGLLGDWKKIGEILELRIATGPGYRLYAGEDGDTIVVLLIGGDKSSQKNDIKKAMEYWNDYKEKKKENG